MISLRTVTKYCGEDISKIENYDKAIADDSQVWTCHHRLEIQGDKRYTSIELVEMKLYYNRPASELIFMTRSEHAKLHGFNNNSNKTPWNKGKRNIYSKETREKIANTLKGNIPWNKGKKMSESYKESCKKGWITRKNKKS